MIFLTIICAFIAGHIIAIGIFAPKSDPVALNIIQFAIVAIGVFYLCLYVMQPFQFNIIK